MVLIKYIIFVDAEGGVCDVPHDDALTGYTTSSLIPRIPLKYIVT